MTRDDKMVMFILFLDINMKVNIENEYHLTIDIKQYDSFIGRISKHYGIPMISHIPFTTQTLIHLKNLGFIDDCDIGVSNYCVQLKIVLDINKISLIISAIIYNYGTMRDVLKGVIGELMNIQNKIIEEKMVKLL